MKYFVALFLAMLLFSCSSPKEKLVGTWKVVKTDVNGPQETDTIFENFYRLIHGSQVIYEHGRARRESSKKWFSYTFNEKKSEIVFDNEVIHVLKLTSDSLVTSETTDGGTLITSMVRIK